MRWLLAHTFFIYICGFKLLDKLLNALNTTLIITRIITQMTGDQKSSHVKNQ